jgi:scyllo-inositol 2-dehydrogenase (NADP+)
VIDRLKVGIVGFGRIGAEHAGWITASDRLRVGVVYDPTPARAQIAEQRGLRTCGTVDALVDDASVDVVLVSTPTSMHADHARRAIDAGKHVMIEKPMALTHADAAELDDAARRRGVRICVFHCRRWDIDFLTVGELIRSGRLGRVFNIESRLGQWASCVGPAAREYRPGWRNEQAFGGGGLFDWGSHFLDQLWQLFLPAKPVRVFAQLRGNVWTGDCDDLARVCVDFSDGGVGVCEINTTTTRPLPRWHLDGTLGSADAPHSPVFDTQQWSRLSMTSPTGETVPIAPASPGLSETQIWDAFAGAIRGDNPPPIDVAGVLLTMRLLDAARASAASGSVIAV